MAKKRKLGHKQSGKRRSSKQRSRDDRTARLAEVAQRQGITIDEAADAVDSSYQSGPLALEGNHHPIRGRGDSGGLLTDPHRARSDAKLVNMAVRRGWNVRRKRMIRNRLENIVAKETATVFTKKGPMDCATKADELAIQAAKVLTAMDGQDIKRVEVFEKEAPATPPGSSTTVNINVNSNDGGIDPRRTALARLAAKLGARELTIDGRATPVDDLLESTGRVSESESDIEESA